MQNFPSAFFTLLMIIQNIFTSQIHLELASSRTAPLIRNPENISQHCVCVPFWQCEDDFSGLVANGEHMLDIRTLHSTSSSSIQSNLYNQQSAANNLNQNNQLQPCTGDFDVCCLVECGRTNIKKQNLSPLTLRILGDAHEAEFGEFPWMLGILRNQAYQCGASLIHPQVALTAAHCVFSPGNYKIRAGEWNWEETNEAIGHQDRFIKKIIIHPDFQEQTLWNDIALIILNEPFELSENVGVICLPVTNTKIYNLNLKHSKAPHLNSITENSDYYSVKNCVASGWGRNSAEKGTYQSILKKIDLPTVPKDQCLFSLQRALLGPNFQLHESFICAGGENKDTCKGDGGSPLICAQNEHKIRNKLENFVRYEQIGIVSWGLTCGVKNTPGVYVNVALFTNWIDLTMESHNFDSSIYKPAKS